MNHLFFHTLLALLCFAATVAHGDNNMTWFERLVGFEEVSPQQVRENLQVLDDKYLISKANGKRYMYGQLEILSLEELRDRVDAYALCSSTTTTTTIRDEVANVQNLHKQKSNANALFQVASQFNLLEMVSPQITPERGVSIYEHDATQGPACAIAAGAGTIYRNYLVPLPNGQVGQSKSHQIDCLRDLGTALGNQDERLWKMKNGYCLAKTTGLQEISQRLWKATDQERYKLQGLLRVGIMWDTQVTLSDDTTPSEPHVVSQVYCSALPVLYSIHSLSQWEAFARLVLEGAYEATLCAAVLNYRRTGNNKVYLTTLGGGAFGNKMQWIMEAMKRAIALYREYGLDIVIVSYGKSDAHVQQLITEVSKEQGVL